MTESGNLGVLFLGAGASRAEPLNLPTTKEFMSAVSDVADRSQLYQYMLERLTESLDTQDVEEVLAYLDDFISREAKRGFKFIADELLAIKLGQAQRNVSVSEWLNQARAFRDAIRLRLFDEYGEAKVTGEKVSAVYGPLFEVMNEITSSSEIPVFTTNYDPCIEVFADTAQGRNFDFENGFVARRRGTSRRELDISQYSRDPGELPQIKLYKLHGSLSWRRTNDDRVEDIGTDVPFESPLFEGNVIVYPGGVKDEAGYPFVELHRLFSESMQRAQACVVVGYSFRDESINRVLRKFADKKGGVLIVLSPSAEETAVNNLYAGKRPPKNVRYINRKLGDSKALDEMPRLWKV